MGEGHGRQGRIGKCPMKHNDVFDVTVETMIMVMTE